VSDNDWSRTGVVTAATIKASPPMNPHAARLFTTVCKRIKIREWKPEVDEDPARQKNFFARLLLPLAKTSDRQITPGDIPRLMTPVLVTPVPAATVPTTTVPATLIGALPETPSGTLPSTPTLPPPPPETITTSSTPPRKAGGRSKKN
jgi:hypothetical protein